MNQPRVKVHLKDGIDPPMVIGLLRWPDGMDFEDRAIVVADAFGLADTAAQPIILAKGPVLAATMPATMAFPALVKLRDLGIRAAICPGGYKDEPLRVKRMIPGAGVPPEMYCAEFWRSDEGRPFPTKDIAALVRGTISVAKKTSAVDRIDAMRDASGFASSGGILGRSLAQTLDAAEENVAHAGMPAMTDAIEVLDVFLRDRTWLRCDGRKFGFMDQPEKGPTDRYNTDVLTSTLGEAAPGSMIDLGFSQLRVLPGVLERARARIGPRKVQKSDPESVFDFYSGMIGLLATEAYQH
ncbi:MAG: hypothetical protein AAGB51_03440 [Planctomycetota bacterium]